MLDGGGGGGGWPTTNWYDKDLPGMWTQLSGQMTPGATYTAPHWDHVAGWQKVIELASLNKYRMEELRREIVAVWPTDKSPAAQAYVAKLDELITSLTDVYDRAVSSYDYAKDMVATLAGTTHKVKEYHDQWLAQQRIIDEQTPIVAQEQTQHPRSRRPVTGQTPSQKLANATVEQQRLEKLARSEMYKLSGDLNLARGGIQPPQPFKAPLLKSDTGTDQDGGGGAPVIPPIVPAVSGASGSPSVGSVPTVKPVPTGTVGPGLTGVVTTTPPPPPTIGIPTPTPITPTPAPIAPPVIPGLIGPNPVPAGTGPVFGRPGMPPGGLIGADPTAAARGGMPAGGVIGGAPGAAGGRAGAAGMRAMPPGGVISGAPGAPGVPGGRAGGALGGRATGMAPGMPGAPGARPGQRRENDPNYDPDTEWDLAYGVAPVLDTPDAPGPVDPGPAIGLTR